MKHLRLFETEAVFESEKSSLELPCVALTEDDTQVHIVSNEPLPSGFVDLGLPSGLKWANMNVGATSETDPGLYFMWGDTEGHEKGSGYDFSNANYTAKGLDAISTDLTLAQDAAAVNMGGRWRMPTKTEFEELYNNTNVTWVDDFEGTGVAGRKFVNKTDASKYIFMPAAGSYGGSSLNGWGSNGRYWSSKLAFSSYAYGFIFNSSEQSTDNSNRYYGRSVRGVLPA